MEFKILIADDHEEFLDTMALGLMRENYTPILCINGNELMHALRSDDMPCLVFLDIHMQEKDGIEVLKELAALTKRIRVRFITGGAIPHVIAAELIARSNGLDLGPTLYKPFSLARLVEVIKEDGELLFSPPKPQDPEGPQQEIGP